MLRIFIISFLCIHLCTASSLCLKSSLFRDTDEWKTLFIGKCLLYKNGQGQDVLCNSNVNCTELWHMVKEAIAFETKCNFSSGRYEKFLNASEHFVPKNKFIFWSGVYSLVMRYSNKGQKFFTIADTLTGYLFDNLEWCGNSTESDGIEKYPSTCPGFCLGDESAQSAFWAESSQHFARNAYGEIHIMLNASRTPAFRTRSFFTSHELPNLNPAKIQKATILMVHYFDEPVLENCSSPSILELTSRLKAKGITPACVDNPRAVRFLLCSDNPTHSECEELVSSARRNNFINYFIYMFLMEDIKKGHTFHLHDGTKIDLVGMTTNCGFHSLYAMSFNGSSMYPTLAKRRNFGSPPLLPVETL